MSKKSYYYLGLDIGSDSVGFCVTDRDYNIVAKRAVRYRLDGTRYYTRKHLWGSRLFDEASSAADRRSHRTARRRYQRRRWRLLLLREFFQDEIDKIDPTFFDRLDHSFFLDEDKPDALRGFSIPYPDKRATKQFYKDNKTIYHLRYKLLTEPDYKFDLREIYLAFSHMVKYRGNFLHEGDIHLGSSSCEELKGKFDELDSLLSEMDSEDGEPVELFHLTKEQAEKLYELFKQETRKSVLKEQEKGILPLENNKGLPALLLSLINGTDVKIVDLFPEFKEDEGLKDEKVLFNGDDYEAKTIPLLSSLGDDLKMSLVVKAKEIYDFRILTYLLQGKESISAAMVSSYEKHKRDLKKLKGLMRKYLSHDVYVSFFKKKDAPSYASYIGFNRPNGGKQESSLKHGTSKDDLYKKIRQILPLDLAVSDEDKPILNEIHLEMDKGTFLPRQNSKDNGVLPYQLTFDEMKEIIDRQKKFYPFLAQEDKDFRNPEKTCYKLLSLVSFRVPYYVGPLSEDKGKGCENHWMKRKVEDVKITPWNFFDVVDTSASGEEFIKRMKNVCTYLLNEETLPKNSMLYTEYALLNETNNWLINGKPISQEDKEYLIREVYLKVKKPTKTNLVDALCRKYNAASKNEVRIQTRTAANLEAEDIHANLIPWIDMITIFGKDVLEKPEVREKAEKAIETITVFESRKEKQKKLQELGLGKDEIKKLVNLNYSGWGKLSKSLLDGITTPVVNSQTAEEQDLTIIELMLREPLNLMEIIESKNKFDFRQKIDELNEEGQLTLEDVIESEYVSPGMRRALHQSVKVVQELKKILGIEKEGFDSYFVECTREKSKTPTRTVSRLQKLKNLYDALKVDDKELRESLEEETNETLQKDKLFLYYLQLGKSVYTGMPIGLDNLKDYDIDHIIPQEKLKDDSIDNRVLVEKAINNKKSDSYPIPKDCLTDEGRKQIEVLYSKMVDKNHVLMSSEKYRRLMRYEPLTDEELTGFVNRQLVMTNQSVKAVCDVLKFIDPRAKVVYSKASVVSDFRKAFELVKSRDVNDFHHAHDAYLNIVVGNVYNKVFSSSFDVEHLRRLKEYFESTKIDAEHFFKRDKRQTGTSTLVWKAKRYDKDTKLEDPESQGTIDLVRANLFDLHDPMVTKMPKTQTTMFNKTSIHPKDNSAILPLKASGPYAKDGFALQYGGYNDLSAPDFMLVKSIIKNKTIFSLENIPTVYRSQLKDEKSKLAYLAKTLGLKNPEIILPTIKINSVVEFNSPDNKGRARVTINGKSGQRIIASIASPLWLPIEFVKYVKSLSVFLGTNLPAGLPKPRHDNIPDNDEDIKFGNIVISKNENQKLFAFLCDDVFKRPCFAFVPGVGSTLKAVSDKKESFTNLSTKKQAEVLHRLIILLQNENLKADLVYLGLSKHSGVLFFSKKCPPLTRFIAQSVTGFYEKILFTVPAEE